MASNKGMAPTVLLPTVPGMGPATPTKGTSMKASSRVVKVPTAGRTTPKYRPPRIKVSRPKMPKDANALMVPKAKKVKNGKEFAVGRKPVI
jgi:hypothetical protein